MDLDALQQYDPELAKLAVAEEKRQREGLELIPSENYVSRSVLEALGTVFTNKYSEGFPGRRYYGGQENTDQIETIAIERAKALFGCDHANVQPHSGAPANEAVYSAWVEPGETILGMELSHGGHLTHGRPGTMMAKIFNFVRYGMKDIETGEIDYDEMRETALKHKPKIIIAGFSAYPRELDYAKFAEIGREVGAVLMADVAHIAGLIAGKTLANPFDHGFHVVTTTTHKTLRGPRGGMVLSNGTPGNPLKEPEKKIENLPTLIDRTVFPGIQGGPHMHSILAKAVAFGEAGQPEFQVYCQQVLKNAKRLAGELTKRGFRLVTGGTDNHMVLADVYSSFAINGKQAEETLDKIGLTLNKNMIADDPLPPYRPSGIRLGTPAITTRGMKEGDMEQVARWMHDAITHHTDEAHLAKLRAEVTEFSLQFPLPSDQPEAA
ncbi:MAG TPA: serine hydroxymethyltransferase [Candidatus Saccharimonadales bacterium]|nr:serine hydroxymethyltransferase [Candidatus Saccharimonadales bacterium]